MPALCRTFPVSDRHVSVREVNQRGIFPAQSRTFARFAVNYSTTAQNGSSQERVPKRRAVPRGAVPIDLGRNYRIQSPFHSQLTISERPLPLEGHLFTICSLFRPQTIESAGSSRSSPDRKIAEKRLNSYRIAKICRTSVETIEEFYASHIKTRLDAAAINITRKKKGAKVVAKELRTAT